MPDLSTIRAFALRTGWFPAVRGEIACGTADSAFLFLACEAAFFVAV